MGYFFQGIPTKVQVEEGLLSKSGEVIKSHFSDKTHVMIVVGGMSAKENGYLATVENQLTAAGYTSFVYDGIEPNPRAKTINQGGAVCRDNRTDMIVALGGGSVMDAAKAIALVGFDGNATNIADYGMGANTPPKGHIDVITIPTLAATGSECDYISVYTDEKTSAKVPTFMAPWPCLSLVDPSLNITVPMSYRMEGALDMISHVIEFVLNSVDRANPIIEGMNMSLIKGVIHASRDIYKGNDSPENREVLSTGSWLALNGSLSLGYNPVVLFVMHWIAHELGALSDKSHGGTLSAIIPAFMKMTFRERINNYAEMGRQVFEINEDNDDIAAEKAVEAFIGWMDDIHLPTTIGKLGPVLSDDQIDRMAANVTRISETMGHPAGGYESLMNGGIKRLYKASM